MWNAAELMYPFHSFVQIHICIEGLCSQVIIIIIIIIQFFIIYVPSQQLQVQLQTRHSVHAGNYIMEKQNIKTIAT
jgi:hypothetical protein